MTKLETLAEIEGMTVEELLDSSVCDSVVPGICKNKGCDYTTSVEPDQDKGYCEACGTQTVASALILAGII
jgi:hypothetical protein